MNLTRTRAYSRDALEGTALTTREQIFRARPRVDGPTYRVVKGEITRVDYARELNAERVRHGLPEIRSTEPPKPR